MSRNRLLATTILFWLITFILIKLSCFFHHTRVRLQYKHGVEISICVEKQCVTENKFLKFSHWTPSVSCRLWLREGWPTRTRCGTKSVFSARAAKLRWLANPSPRRGRVRTVSSVSAACMPKSVPAATRPSQVSGEFRTSKQFRCIPGSSLSGVVCQFLSLFSLWFLSVSTIYYQQNVKWIIFNKQV